VSGDQALGAGLAAARAGGLDGELRLIREYAQAQLEAGGPMLTLRCAYGITVGRSFPELRVEVERWWPAGRWELRHRGDGGEIAASPPP